MTMELPIIIHRWFPDGGEGWAYHPQVRNDFVAIVRRLTKRMLSGENSKSPFRVPFRDGCLVGEKIEDYNCQFRSSDDRNPHIVRCVYYPFGLLEESRASILLKNLQRIELPDFPGENPDLLLRIETKEDKDSKQTDDSIEVQYAEVVHEPYCVLDPPPLDPQQFRTTPSKELERIGRAVLAKRREDKTRDQQLRGLFQILVLALVFGFVNLWIVWRREDYVLRMVLACAIVFMQLFTVWECWTARGISFKKMAWSVLALPWLFVKKIGNILAWILRILRFRKERPR